MQMFFNIAVEFVINLVVVHKVCSIPKYYYLEIRSLILGGTGPYQRTPANYAGGPGMNPNSTITLHAQK